MRRRSCSLSVDLGPEALLRSRHAEVCSLIQAVLSMLASARLADFNPSDVTQSSTLRSSAEPSSACTSSALQRRPAAGLCTVSLAATARCE